MANNPKSYIPSSLGIPSLLSTLYSRSRDAKAETMAERGREILKGKEQKKNNMTAMENQGALANLGMQLPEDQFVPHENAPLMGDSGIPMESLDSRIADAPLGDVTAMEGLGAKHSELQQLHQEMTKEQENIEPSDDPLTDASEAAITGKRQVDNQKITNIQTRMDAINQDLQFEEQGEEQEAEYKGEWENDNHVWGGTQRFFTSLLKTGNIGQAFQDAGQYYDEEVDADERSKYAVELEDDYTPASIAEWVKSGNEAELVTNSSLQQGHLNNEAKAAEIVANEQKNLLNGEFGVRDRQLGQEHKMASINSLNASAANSAYTLQQKRIAQMAQADKTAKDKNEYQGKATMGAFGGALGLESWNAYRDDLRAKGETYALKSSGTFATRAAINNYFEKDPGMKNAMVASMSKATYKAIESEQMFLKSVLRLESGAAIGEAEWKQYGAIFFPRQDDTPADEARKALARNMAVASMAQLGIMTKGKEGDMQRQSAMNTIISNMRNVVAFNPELKAYKTKDGKWRSAKALALH